MLTEKQKEKYDWDIRINLCDDWLKEKQDEFLRENISVKDIIEYQHSLLINEIEKTIELINSKKDKNDHIIFSVESAASRFYLPDEKCLEKTPSLFELLAKEENKNYLEYVFSFDPATVCDNAGAANILESLLIKDNKYTYLDNNKPLKNQIDYSESRFSGLIPYLYSNHYQDLYKRMIQFVIKAFEAIPKFTFSLFTTALNFTYLYDSDNYELFLPLYEKNKTYIESSKLEDFSHCNEPETNERHHLTQEQTYKYKNIILDGLTKTWLEIHRKELHNDSLHEEDIVEYQHYLLFQEIEKTSNFIKNNNRGNCDLIFHFMNIIRGFYKPDRQCLEKIVSLFETLIAPKKCNGNTINFLLSFDSAEWYGCSLHNNINTLIIKDNNLFSDSDDDTLEDHLTFRKNRFSGLIPYLYFSNNWDLFERMSAVVESLVKAHASCIPIYISFLNFSHFYNIGKEKYLCSLFRRSRDHSFSGNWDGNIKELFNTAYKDLNEIAKKAKTIEDLIDFPITEPTLKSKRTTKSSEITKGSIIEFGKFPQRNNKPQPIEWEVLDIQDDEALIVSNKILFAGSFDDESNNYKNSKIRHWLNHDFFSLAFNKQEQNKILITKVDNSERSCNRYINPSSSILYGHPTITCEDTEDHVFLLSVMEVTNPNYGFEWNEDYFDPKKAKKVTPYALKNGARVNKKTGIGRYYLRSPSSEITYGAMNINEQGGYVSQYNPVNDPSCGIVPAMWIKI